MHTQFPAWESGFAYRAGGSYFSDGPSATNVFNGCYHEGDQGKAQLVAPSLVVGGNLANHVLGTAGIIRAVAGGYLEASLFKSLGSFRAEGSSVFGSTSGGNLAVTFDNGATSNTLTFRSTSGSTQIDGAIVTSRNQGMTIRGFGPAGAQGNVNLASGTTIVARAKSSGFNVLSGFSYQHNDLQVVGARKPGWSFDTGTAKRSASVTYAAGPALPFGAAYDQAEHAALAIRLAAVEAALQDSSQTIKALKDDLHASAGHGLIGT